MQSRGNGFYRCDRYSIVTRLGEQYDSEPGARIRRHRLTGTRAGSVYPGGSRANALAIETILLREVEAIVARIDQRGRIVERILREAGRGLVNGHELLGFRSRYDIVDVFELPVASLLDDAQQAYGSRASIAKDQLINAR